MKALILVGGYGTRLRPLTLSVPKPLVEFANKPMVVHQIIALKNAGVSEVVLAINYKPDVMAAFIEEWSAKLNIKITISREEEPMGTAGPLALARQVLDDGSGEPFFVLNSDVICEYPLQEMLEFHKAKGAEATILVTKVEDPSAFGVVVTDGDMCVERFVEKPKEFVGDKINAGIYLISPSTLNRIEMRPTSIERETFPAIAADKRLFAFTLSGYWMDVGKPKDYLTGLRLHLQSLRTKTPEALAKGDCIKGDVIMDESVTVGEGSVIGPNVSVGKGVRIGKGVRLSNCVVMSGATLLDYCRINESIVGWDCHIGRWGVVQQSCVLGTDVFVHDELLLNGAVVLPHKEIKQSVEKPEIIL